VTSLEILNRFEERERLPKKLHAIFRREDHGRQWWLTLTIHINVDAENFSQHCIENEIYATKKPSRRIKAITGLFNLAVDFSRVPYIDNTVTRIRLRTNLKSQPYVTNTFFVPTALHQPLPPYMGTSLDGLECLVDEDDTTAIPYATSESYRARYPCVPFVQYRDIIGIEENESKLAQGVYKVMDITRNESYIYKEPKIPDDIKSQCNEIEALLLLSNSPHIIKLRGLVVSTNPYITQLSLPSQPIVRGFLLQYASYGTLGNLLATDSQQLLWSQRLSWAKQIALGLQAIHDAGMFHMDLKSFNVVIDEKYDAFIIDLARNGTTYGWNAPETYVDKDQTL
jgi:hypothetical protein